METKPKSIDAATIAQLIIALGPSALTLIPQLAALWEKEELTVAEVTAACDLAKKNYEDYIAGA